MIVTLFGVAAFLAGWGMMKLLWFPICFLAVPCPGLPWFTVLWHCRCRNWPPRWRCSSCGSRA